MEDIASGHSAKAAWKLKLIEDWGGFESTVEASRVDERAKNGTGKRNILGLSELICLPNE